VSHPASSSKSSLSFTSPLAPDLVLRVGFAGKRQLDPSQSETVAKRLLDVFSVIGWRLVEISPLDDASNERAVPTIAKFYSHKRPTLRLIHGLCEGADSIASGVLQDLVMPALEKDFAAVVPFPIADYRASRDPDFLPDFDQQLAACSYVVVPDGIYDKPEAAISSSSNQKLVQAKQSGDGSTIENLSRQSEATTDHQSSISPLPTPPDRLHLSNRRRARAYRCQSALLLRQSDILVAVVNPDLGGKPGGTLETVRSALDFELPVVLVHPDTGEVFLIEPGDDLLAVFTHDSGISTGWQETLAAWVTQITADPERSEDATGNASASHGLGLMNEFFSPATTQPRKTLREQFWIKFLNRFKPAQTKTPSGPSAAAFAPWRNRASELSGRYSGLYRGTYFLNHLLAVTAVLLAAWSLVLMGKTSTQLTEWVQGAADLAHIAQPATDPAKKSPDFAPWVFPVLLALAALKLWIVVFIFRSTHAAIHGEWNDRAVDYRYISERLRALNYLPLIGSFQPPAAAPAQYASRVVRQSAVDWLFDAIIRSVSPAHFAKDAEIPRANATPIPVKVLHIDPADSLDQIGKFWILSQAAYHCANETTMQRLSSFLERWGKTLNIAVITVVGIDVLLVTAKLTHLIGEGWKGHSYVAGALLVFVAAVIPAAVAAFNGIRFQSECQRLAERSAVMHTILEGSPDPVTRKRSGGRLAEVKRLQSRIHSAKEHPNSDPGSWTLESLHLSEKVANDFVQEVAEWSVLYAKELVEP
jgi:hypothetical protein